jgi:hypothetical protein
MTELAKERYPVEVLGADDDDGTMVESLKAFTEAVVGHKIVATRKGSIPGAYWGVESGTALLLDTGQIVWMGEQGDCCAYTDLEEIIDVLPSIEHVITGVGTSEGYTTWHIYANMGDVMQFKVGWSCGNPFYYAYGFNVRVYEPDNLPELAQQFKELEAGSSAPEA